jgi:hypothetical protein
MAINSAIGYSGDLVVVCVPKSATFNITLSDVPNVRAPERPLWNFSGANHMPVNPPASKAPQGASTARKGGDDFAGDAIGGGVKLDR